MNTLLELFGSVLPTNVKRVPPLGTPYFRHHILPPNLVPFRWPPVSNGVCRLFPQYTPLAHHSVPPSASSPWERVRGELPMIPRERVRPSGLLPLSWNALGAIGFSLVQQLLTAERLRRRISLDVEKGCFQIILIKKSYLKNVMNRFFLDRKTWEKLLL